MQKVSIICVGKMKEKFYIDAAAEYAKRLSRFCKLEIIELPEDRLPEDPSQAQIDAALAKEADEPSSPLPLPSSPCAWKARLVPARNWPVSWQRAPTRVEATWFF